MIRAHLADIAIWLVIVVTILSEGLAFTLWIDDGGFDFEEVAAGYFGGFIVGIIFLLAILAALGF